MDISIPQEQQVQISPLAILAGVLFNMYETEQIKVKMDDSEEEKEVMAKVVGIEKEEDAILCIIPIEKILKFAQIPYDFKLKIENGHALMFFEKQYNKTPIYAVNGQKVTTQSPKFERLLERLK